MNFIKVILIGILFTALKVNAGQSFLDFKVNSEMQDVKLYLNASNGRPFGQFKLLDKHLSENNQKLIFAMNAGIFMENLFPLGLYVENGVLIKKINLRKHAYGNFYMQPNGVFSIKNNGAYIDSSFKYKKNDVLYATQSGPMLIVNNQFNPMVNVKSKNKIIRNGVCVNESLQVILTISLKPVTMHEMAKHFKEECKCKDALYLDGAISQIYWPQKGYFGKTSLIGPIIGVTQKNNEYNK